MNFEKGTPVEPYYPKYIKKKKKKPKTSLPRILRAVSEDSSSSSISEYCRDKLYRDRSPVCKSRSHKRESSRYRRIKRHSFKSFDKEYDWKERRSYDKDKHRNHLKKTKRNYREHSGHYIPAPMVAHSGLTSSNETDSLNALYSREQYGPNPLPNELTEKMKTVPCSSQQSLKIDAFLQAERSLASESSSGSMQQQQEESELPSNERTDDFIEIFHRSGVPLSVLLDWLENLKKPINPQSTEDYETLKAVAEAMYQAVNKYKSTGKSKTEGRIKLQNYYDEQIQDLCEIQDDWRAGPSSNNIVILPGENVDSNDDSRQHNSLQSATQNMVKQDDSLQHLTTLHRSPQDEEYPCKMQTITPNEIEDCSKSQSIQLLVPPIESVENMEDLYYSTTDHAYQCTMEHYYQTAVGNYYQDAMGHSYQGVLEHYSDSALAVPSSTAISIHSSDSMEYPSSEKIEHSSLAMHPSVFVNQSSLGSTHPLPLRMMNSFIPQAIPPFMHRPVRPFMPQRMHFVPQCFSSFVPCCRNLFRPRAIGPIASASEVSSHECTPFIQKINSQDFMNSLHNATKMKPTTTSEEDSN